MHRKGLRGNHIELDAENTEYFELKCKARALFVNN